jgi:hypothetical protein
LTLALLHHCLDFCLDDGTSLYGVWLLDGEPDEPAVVTPALLRPAG